MKLSYPAGGRVSFDRVKDALSQLLCCILQIKQWVRPKNHLYKGIQHLPRLNSWSNLYSRLGHISIRAKQTKFKPSRELLILWNISMVCRGIRRRGRVLCDSSILELLRRFGDCLILDNAIMTGYIPLKLRLEPH
jgi:hypothetical protein